MTTKQVKDLREQLQEDLRTALDGAPQAMIDAACQVVVNRLQPTKKGRTFILTFKNPDAIDNSLVDEPTAVQKAAKAFLPKYVRDGEYLDLEVDVDNKTFEVLKTPRGY